MPPWEPAEVRFWRKVNQHGPVPSARPDLGACWQWTAGRNPLGYGRFWTGMMTTPAHRFAYELLVGPIPEGLVIDHLCRVPCCVRPDHIEPVPQRVNAQRGIHPRGADHVHGSKTHCHRGHPFSEENTYRTPSGRRVCRACSVDYQRAWNKQHPGKGAEYQRAHRERKRRVA